MAAEAPRRSKWKRRLLIALPIVVGLLLVIAFFLPYLLKRYIEKNSVAWIDRQVTIDYLVLNPFTFKYGLYGVTCYEPKGSDKVFVSWKEISTRSNLWAGFQENHWRFTTVRIIDPYFHISQRGDRFNFSDLMELGGSDTSAVADTSSSTVVFSMEDIVISGGRIDYDSDIMKAPVQVIGLRAECNRITSESARMDFDLGFALGSGGAVDGGFMIDTDRSSYAVQGKVEKLDLAAALPYLQDFMHTQSLAGTFDLDLDLYDSWADTAALAVRAELGINGFGISDQSGEALLGAQTIRVDLDTLNARNSSFKLSRILVSGLDTRYQQWADGSNTWTKALKLEASESDTGGVQLAASEDNIFLMLADYIRMLGQDFVASEYTADSMVFTQGKVHFEDFTPEKPFRYVLSDLDVRSSRVNSAAGGTADFHASATLNGSGTLTSLFAFDPTNFKNVHAALTVDELALHDLDPYTRWYAAHPIQSGKLHYEGQTVIKDGLIQSGNTLHVSDLKFGKKTSVHDTGIYVLPLRLATGLLKDVKGNIDLDIPVEGNLSDPSFKVWPIVWQVLKNLITKAAAAPVRLVAGAFQDVDEDDIQLVRFAPTQTALAKAQRKPLDMLAKLLKEKPELAAVLVPVADQQQLREEWAATAAKKRFLGLEGVLSSADSSKVQQLALRDDDFLAFLNSNNASGASERERCVALIGADKVAAAVKEQEAARQAAVKAYLQEAGVAAERITFRVGTKEETAGFIGDPGFRFVFEAD